MERVVSLHLRPGWRVFSFCFERFFWKNMDGKYLLGLRYDLSETGVINTL